MPETCPAALRVGDLHVEVSGTGAPVLLIHGNNGDLHYFDGIVPGLERTFRVVRMDCRGQGRSARGDGPLTIRRMADDAADVIRAVQRDGEPFAVVGFSDGANVAMALAIHHPELVSALVLNAGNTRRSGMHLVVRAHVRSVDVLLWRRHPSPSVRRRRELNRLMLDQPGISRAALAGVDVPALVVAGTRDIIRRAHTRMIARVIPGAQLRIVRRGTHFLMRDLPEIANPMIDGFLRTGAAPMDHARVIER
jgi:pimeloyl-ACP methyl ester carboxylesterase